MTNDGQQETQRIYAWLSYQRDGTEGIISVDTTLGVPVPLMATDLNVMEGDFKTVAMRRCAATFTTGRLVVFNRGETLDTI